MSPSFEPEEIIDPSRALELARNLNRGRRERPAVVISTSADGPRIDAARVATELGPLASVHLLTNPECSAAFSEAMPSQAQVYGGAARTFPAALTWVLDPTQAPLRFPHSAAQGAEVTIQLIEDGLAAAARSGAVRNTASGNANEVTAVVRGCPTPSQAMVEIDGNYASVQAGLVFPGLVAERMFTPGMTVRGILDPRTRQLDISGSLPDAADRLAEIGDGDVIWIQVGSVAERECTLFPYPGAPMVVSWEEVTTSAADDLRDLLSDGDIVPARGRRTQDGDLTLSLADVDENDEPRPALAIFPGGPPWLLPPGPVQLEPGQQAESVQPKPVPLSVIPSQASAPARESTQSAAPAPTTSQPVTTRPVSARPSPLLLANRASGVVQAPTAPAPIAPSQAAAPAAKPSASVRSMGLQLDAARARAALLETELKAAERRVRAISAENQLLERDLDEQARELTVRETEIARLKSKLRKDIQEERRTGQRIGVHGGDLFLDPEEQFRFDVQLRWALRIPAAEKADRPLRPYHLGPAFLESLKTVQGVDHFKVVDVVVEVLTGLAETSGGRQMHTLRVGLGPDDETVRRGEYTCWRIAIQRHTPQARRLHFWRSADDIELSRVVLHDDFTP